MSRVNQSTFLRHADGRITVDCWPDQQRFDARFLAAADPAFLHRDGDLVVIYVANGQAAYRLGALEADDCYPGLRVTSRIEPAT